MAGPQPKTTTTSGPICAATLRAGASHLSSVNRPYMDEASGYPFLKPGQHKRLGILPSLLSLFEHSARGLNRELHRGVRRPFRCQW